MGKTFEKYLNIAIQKVRNLLHEPDIVDQYFHEIKVREKREQKEEKRRLKEYEKECRRRKKKGYKEEPKKEPIRMVPAKPKRVHWKKQFDDLAERLEIVRQEKARQSLENEMSLSTADTSAERTSE